MKKNVLFLIIISLFISCKANQTINGKREGKWKFTSTINDTLYFEKGRYKNGIESGVWKSYENKKLVRKEIYKGKTGYMTNYYPNGKIQSEGTTKIEETDKHFSWSLSGDWKYYDKNGTLYLTRIYLNGNIITESYPSNSLKLE